MKPHPTTRTVPTRAPRRAGLGAIVGVAAACAACNPPDSGPRRGNGPTVAEPVVLPDPAPPVAAPPVAAPPAAGVAVGQHAGVEPAGAGWGWNDAQIAWQPFEAGLARARAEHKPVCLVFHADWCGHCRNYSHVFEDPRIVARARDLVMVRVDTDHAPEVASRFQLDGSYVPRTFFLTPEGTAMVDVDAHRPQYRYFFNEHDPASLLAGMDAALARR